MEHLSQHISENRDTLREVPKKQQHTKRPKLKQLFEENARSNREELNLAVYKAHVDII